MNGNRSTGKGPNDTPTVAFFGLQRAWLAQNGFTQQQINQAIGTAPNGRSNKEINNELNGWLKDRA